MVLANDANAAGSALVMADEKVSFHRATIAVAQREHSRAIQKRIRAIRVFARLVGDDFNLAITTLEQVVFHECARIRHRLMAVADANRLAAIAPERRSMSE